jgi:muramoyltetrapeptide carboxypeptidase
MGFSLATPRADWVTQSFLNALFGRDPLDVPYPRGTCVVEGVEEGLTAGGCLVPFMDSLATADEIDMEGKILLIEDVGERAHRVDAMFTHLIRTGKIQRCAGIVIGEMTDTDELSRKTPDGKPSLTYKDISWRGIVRERLAPLGLPLMIDFPFGHIADMVTIPLGVPVRMDALAGTLTLA